MVVREREGRERAKERRRGKDESREGGKRRGREEERETCLLTEIVQELYI